MSDDSKKIDEVVEILDALDAKIRVNDAKVQRSERNRLSLLHVHAVFACFIGPLFAALRSTGMAGPSWVLLRAIPGMPYTLGAMLVVGGVILGVATWYRQVQWEIVGLWILMAWYAAIAVGFSGAVFAWLAAGSPPGLQPNFYPAGVYAHVLVILAVHQRTLLKMRRHFKAQR